MLKDEEEIVADPKKRRLARKTYRDQAVNARLECAPGPVSTE